MPGLPPFPTHLRILPSRLAIERRTALGPGDCEVGTSATTFAALFASLGSLGAKRYATPLVCRSLVRSLMAGSAGWMRRAACDPFAVRAVHRALTELRQAGVTAQHLESRELSSGLRALVHILAHYEKVLAGSGLADDADWQRLAVLAVIRGALPADLSRVQRVTVEGGASLFGSRRDLLAALAAGGVRVRVRLPWDSERPALFAWPEASLHHLEARESLEIEVVYDQRTGGGALGELRAAQFSERIVEGAPVRLLQVSSSVEHGRSAALQVAGWLRQGVPAHDICVAVPDMDELGGVICEALASCSIPAYSRRGVRLDTTVTGRALIWGLRLADRGFPREELLDLWRLLDRDIETVAGPLSADRVAAMVRRAGVRSARLLGYREALVAQAHQQARHEDDESVAMAMAVATALESLMEHLSALPSRAPLDEQVRAVERLMAAVELDSREPSTFAGDPDGARSERRAVLRAQSRCRDGAAAVGDLLVEFRQAARTLPPGHHWHREEVADTLRLLLGERRLRPRGMRAGSVAVVAIEDLVEARFSHLVLAGIDADGFPRASTPDMVLTEELRGETNRLLGPRLLQASPMSGRGALQRRARDLWLWMEALAACEQELVVTYTAPDTEAMGNRSELVDELHRSLGEPPICEAEPTYVSAAPASLSQVLQRWSLGRLRRTACIADCGTSDQAQALDRMLANCVPARQRSIIRRVKVECAIRSPERRVGRLSPAHREQLARRLVGGVQSASGLDVLGMCRFRHFAQVILGLSRELVPTLGPDAREEGSAAHAALHRVYLDLAEQGGLHAARADRGRAMQRARQVFERYHDQVLAEVAVHPTLRAAALEEAWSAVETQLGYDLDAGESAEPLALEHAFKDGKQGTGVVEIPDPRGQRLLRVRGSIDRVDVSENTLIILDYKRSHRRRSPGRHYQLPIYALVAVRDLRPAAARVMSAWVELRSARRHWAGELRSEPEALATQVGEQLWERLDQILGGDVSPDPDGPQMCRRCDFAALCRYDAARDPEEP